MLKPLFAVGLLLVLAARAGAEAFPEFPTRYYASTAACIVLATPDRDARTFTVTEILTGNLSKKGDIITADPGVYSLARRLEGVATRHPVAALLFLEINPEKKPGIALGGIRLLCDDKTILSTRQESNPGPYTFIPLADGSWDKLLATTREVAGLAAEVHAIASIKPDAARNKAANAWITAHQDSLTGKIFADPTERHEGDIATPGSKPGLSHVEWDAFAIFQRSAVPQDAWRAVTAWIALAPNEAGALPGETDSIAFGNPEGRKLLSSAAADATLSARTRVVALRFLRVALVPNAVGQKRPTDAELEAVEADLVVALRAEDAAVVTSTASILATFHEHFQFGGADGRVIEALTNAYNKAATPELKAALAADLLTVNLARH